MAPSSPSPTTFETPTPIRLDIDIPIGDVHLIAGARTDTRVTVNPADPSRQRDVEAAESTQVDASGDVVTVRTPKAGGLVSRIGFGRHGVVEVTVELPEGSRLAVTTGMGDVRGHGHFGDARVRTGLGEIHLGTTGELDAITGAGHVTVDEVAGAGEVTGGGEMHLGAVHGDVRIKNVNGRTRLGRVDGRLQVKSANGDIIVGQARRDVTATTANGSIRIDEVRAGSVTVETAAGSLEIGIGADTAAWIDATTKFGKVHNSLTTVDTPSTSHTVEVRARTSFGDIVIHRSPAPTT